MDLHGEGILQCIVLPPSKDDDDNHPTPFWHGIVSWKPLICWLSGNVETAKCCLGDMTGEHISNPLDFPANPNTKTSEKRCSTKEHTAKGKAHAR